MSSVVRGNVVDVRVTLAVTIRGSCRRIRVGRLGVHGHAPRAAVQRIAWVAFEWRGQSRIQQSCPGHRLLPVAMTDRVRRLDRLASSRIVGVEQRELIPLPEVGTRDAEQSNPPAARPDGGDLGPG